VSQTVRPRGLKPAARWGRLASSGGLAATGFVAALACLLLAAPAPAATDASLFSRVDLTPLDRVAVQNDGRIRSFTSHALTNMRYVSGPRSINGQSPEFTYLDLMFRPERYRDEDIIYIKSKPLLQEIVTTLEGHGIDAERGAKILKTRLVAPSLLQRPAVTALLDLRATDLIRTAKFVDMIQSGLVVFRSDFLAGQLQIIPPPSGDRKTAWATPDALLGFGGPQSKPGEGFGLEDATENKLAQVWAALGNAWRAGNAEQINAKVAELADLLVAVSPDLYPSQRRLAMESWYFRNGSMTWVWYLYLASVIPLLMAVIYKWSGARAVGLVIFTLAFLLQTASIAIRWYVSGRWPNSNMFEAVTTSAWFGGVGALVIEYLVRRTAVRNLFALGSAVVSMAALMAVHFLPATLDSTLNNRMPALHDIWLYIHTNVIIWSYAVIGLAAVTALLYLAYRWIQIMRKGTIGVMRGLLLPVAVVALNVSAGRVLMEIVGGPNWGYREPTQQFLWFGVLGISAGLVLFEALEARRRRLEGATVERAASGGADALIRGGAGGSFLKPGAPTVAQVLDAGTMVSMEVAFIMLWSGVVMGAIWADHAWGRPWGWDPKETFALNTFIIFLVLVHVRLKVKDKGLWTAALAVVGFEVMMFNWIVINFIVVGLHSYA